MRVSRIYHPAPLTANQIVTLSDDACHHLRVVRANINDEIELFDGSNHIYQAKLIDITKKSMKATIESCQMQNRESPLHLHLGQVISRGEKMEFTIQKSVELGINIITPLLSERCGVKMDQQRFDKKLQQWQKIAISACEQCGRNRIPEIRPIHSLQQWCEDGQHEPDTLKLNLHPRAQKQIKHLELKTPKIRLLIGPEGGLSHDEIQLTEQYAFTDILLGPRVLRTETAALTALTALQVYFGDLG